MRILCRHGHFAFYPDNAKDVARFSNYFDQELERDGDFYTFAPLVGLKRYSLLGKLYGNLPALSTYEGRGPWEVMRENGFVYHLQTKLLVPKLTILNVLQPVMTDGYFLTTTPLIQPGSRNQIGQQILSYDAQYIEGSFQLKVLELSYE